MLGVLLVRPFDRPEFPVALTLEDAWRNNERGVSCIPAGTYICKRFESVRFGSTFLVTNVPGRDSILFHAGTSHKDTRGCILLGRAFMVMEGEARLAYGKIALSVDGRSALEICRDIVSDTDQFTLVIADVYCDNP